MPWTISVNSYGRVLTFRQILHCATNNKGLSIWLDIAGSEEWTNIWLLKHTLAQLHVDVIVFCCCSAYLFLSYYINLFARPMNATHLKNLSLCSDPIEAPRFLCLLPYMTWMTTNKIALLSLSTDRYCLQIHFKKWFWLSDRYFLK